MVSSFCSQKLERFQALVLFHGTFVLNFTILNLTFSLETSLSLVHCGDPLRYHPH